MRNGKLKQVVLGALEDGKAHEITCLDVTNQTDITDFMVVASGTSSRHVKSVAERVIEHAGKAGVRPIGVEGYDEGDWVLIDLADVVVHVMQPKVREFYDLERLWTVGSSAQSSV